MFRYSKEAECVKAKINSHRLIMCLPTEERTSGQNENALPLSNISRTAAFYWKGNHIKKLGSLLFWFSNQYPPPHFFHRNTRRYAEFFCYISPNISLAPLRLRSPHQLLLHIPIKNATSSMLNKLERLLHIIQICMGLWEYNRCRHLKEGVNFRFKAIIAVFTLNLLSLLWGF